MRLNTFFVLPFLVLFFSLPVFSQEKYSPETLKRIAEVENNMTGQLVLNDELPQTITQRMAKHNVKGLSIAIIHDYKIAWAKGYGWADEAEKRPVTTETLFEPGSISKSLNAVGILKLAQDKKLDLNTDINTYLKSWKFPYDSLSKGKKITLTHLLSHQAGLTVHGFPGHDINGPIPTVFQVLDGEKPSFTPAVRSMFEPGLKFQYSGGGTTISQVILTDVTGETYDTWMYKNVLKPIGMTNSFYAQPPARDKRSLCAQAYHADGSPIENKFHVYPEQAAAGLWMTPTDLAHYVIDMQQAYHGKASKVLDPEMVKLHLTPYNNGPTALGTFIENLDGAKYFSHGAGNDGFCGYFIASLDEGYGLVIFLNTDDGKILGEVFNSVAKAYNWKNYYKEPRRRKSIEVDEKTFEAYEGVYLYDNMLASILKKDSAYYYFAGGQYAKMYFSTPTSFFNEEFQADKEFIKNAQGQVTGYTRVVDGKEYPKAIKVTNPDTLKLSAEELGNMGWHLLENQKYDLSIAYFKRAVQADQQDLNMQMNLAHAYLFNHQEQKAIDFYRAHLKDTIWNGTTIEQAIQNDLNYFKEQGFDAKLIDKTFEELGIKKH